MGEYDLVNDGKKQTLFTEYKNDRVHLQPGIRHQKPHFRRRHVLVSRTNTGPPDESCKNQADLKAQHKSCELSVRNEDVHLAYGGPKFDLSVPNPEEKSE